MHPLDVRPGQGVETTSVIAGVVPKANSARRFPHTRSHTRSWFEIPDNTCAAAADDALQSAVSLKKGYPKMRGPYCGGIGSI